MLLKKLNPAVSKYWLIALAGLIWSMAGILIIIFMMMLGIVLRNSPTPRHFLAVIYAAIGGALFVSSFHFYRCVWRIKIQKQPCRPHKDN